MKIHYDHKFFLFSQHYKMGRIVCQFRSKTEQIFIEVPSKPKT